MLTEGWYNLDIGSKDEMWYDWRTSWRRLSHNIHNQQGNHPHRTPKCTTLHGFIFFLCREIRALRRKVWKQGPQTGVKKTTPPLAIHTLTGNSHRSCPERLPWLESRQLRNAQVFPLKPLLIPGDLNQDGFLANTVGTELLRNPRSCQYFKSTLSKCYWMS